MHKRVWGFLVTLGLLAALFIVNHLKLSLQGNSKLIIAVEYAVAQAGITIVTQNVTLTNKGIQPLPAEIFHYYRFAKKLKMFLRMIMADW